MTTTPTTVVPASPLVQRWLAFVRAFGQPCFVGWPDDGVVIWLQWHARHGSLVVIHQGEEILGLAVGWQCHGHELEQHWYADNPAGDCFYFAHCIATSPVAMAELVAELARRKPQWRTLKLYWRRAGRGLVPVRAAAITKLFSLAQRRALKHES